MGLASLPGDPRRDAQTFGPGLHRVLERTAADMFETPVKGVGQLRQGRQQIVITFLFDHASHGDDSDRAWVSFGGGRRGEAIKIEPVIVQQNLVTLSRDQRAQMVSTVSGAGGYPCRVADLLAFLPIRCGPDILGMGRYCEGQAAHPGGVARHRGRGVQKMGVDQAGPWVQVLGQHASLAKPPEPVRRAVAAKILPEITPGSRVAG